MGVSGVSIFEGAADGGEEEGVVDCPEAGGGRGGRGEGKEFSLPSTPTPQHRANRGFSHIGPTTTSHTSTPKTDSSSRSIRAVEVQRDVVRLVKLFKLVLVRFGGWTWLAGDEPGRMGEGLMNITLP